MTTKKNASGLHDPYADQLAAARYRAERDQARQELERERHLRKLAESAAVERETVCAEDHEAAAWVREHGGLEEVRALNWLGAECASIVTGEGRCADYFEADDVTDALRTRLMPEGLEWPRYESGEPFVPGEDGSVELFGDGLVNVWIDGDHQHLTRGERVKRPAPKVLDADGEEIELGDDLYSVEGGLKLHVGAIDTRNGKIATAEMFAIDKWADPSLFTHRAPVLAADGKPLEVGQTVYGIGRTQHRFVVRTANDYEEDEPDGRFCVPCIDKDDGDEECWCDPSQLTHERPVADSWERWREEWQWPPVKYCKLILGVEYDHDTQLQESFDAQGEDLVRRAKALAERDAK